MSDDLHVKSSLSEIQTILADYTDWFGCIAVSIAYNTSSPLPASFSHPTSFDHWVANHEHDEKMIAGVVKIHSTLIHVAEGFIDYIKMNEKPSYEDFLDFKNLFDSFLASLRSLNKQGGNNFNEDEFGLTPTAQLNNDLDREMERLRRNGNPFSLVMVRIDQFSNVSNTHHAALVVASNIKECIRPFDDAYYLGVGMYLLSLKHTDMVGSEAAIMRLQQFLERDEENTENLTISCCLSEPISGDEVDELLKNMQNDLNNHMEDKDAILKFLDISPLERFIGSK